VLAILDHQLLCLSLGKHKVVLNFLAVVMVLAGFVNKKKILVIVENSIAIPFSYGIIKAMLQLPKTQPLKSIVVHFFLIS